MVSNHPANLVAISIAVVENNGFSCWRGCFCYYYLSLKKMVWNHIPHYINNSDPRRTHLKQQMEKKLKIFASLCRNRDEKEKEKKAGIAFAKPFTLQANATKSCWRLKGVRTDYPPWSQHPANAEIFFHQSFTWSMWGNVTLTV